MAKVSVNIENVSDTAFWVAYHRGLEGKRADALFDDPLALELAGERGREIAEAVPHGVFTAWVVAVRTCIIDDYIRAAVANGVDTVVNLGAGLDTRPYRMDLRASLNWIEADYPAVIALKDRVLANHEPACRLERAGLDLADAAERRSLLSRVDAASGGKLLVLTEGVVPYLETQDVALLADDLRSMRRVSGWILDYFSNDVFKQRQRLMRGRLRNAPFKFHPEEWYGFFGEHGWRAQQVRFLFSEGARLKRPFPMPFRAQVIWALRGLFASRRRREDFRRFAGYALLVPEMKEAGAASS
jgi:methyltransferase (TIGR00027 family)